MRSAGFVILGLLVFSAVSFASSPIQLTLKEKVRIEQNVVRLADIYRKNGEPRMSIPHLDAALVDPVNEGL